jgi:hypothetical protein
MHLFNVNKIMHDRVFISNQKMRGESRTAERQKRERECERQCIAGKER